MAKVIASFEGAHGKMSIYENKVVIEPNIVGMIAGIGHQEILIRDIESVEYDMTGGLSLKGGYVRMNIASNARAKYGLDGNKRGSIFKPKGIPPCQFTINVYPPAKQSKEEYRAEIEAKVQILIDAVNKKYMVNNAPSGQSTRGTVDRIAELKKLAQMKADGYLSNTEFEDLKADLMKNC